MGDNPFDAASSFLTRMRSVKGYVRTALLVEDIAKMVSIRSHKRIVDVGCGSAKVTCELMRRGLVSEAILSDPSSDMLMEARSAADSNGISALCELRQESFGDVMSTYHFRSTDVIICHAVLNWLPNPEKSLEILFRIAEKSGASVSLVVGSRFGHVLEQLTRGKFDDLEFVLGSGLIQSESYPDRQLFLFDPVLVLDHIISAGFSVQLRAGIRVVTDLLPDTQKIDIDALVALERAVATHTRLWHLGDLTHFIFRKE